MPGTWRFEDPLSQMYGLPPHMSILLPLRTEARMALALIACKWRLPGSARFYDRTYRSRRLWELRTRIGVLDG